MNWQPIETAPKDGTWVLAASPYWPSGAKVVRWSAPTSCHVPHWNSGAMELYDPDYWTPLELPK